MSNIPESYRARFWPRVDKENGPVHPVHGRCWVWTGARSRRGYSRLSGSIGAFQGHRLSWMLHNGDIPEGLFVCHKCDNPPCVRPEHLFLGTPKDNAADMAAKGRVKSPGNRGERNGRARLRVEDVISIRQRVSSGERPVDVAAEFGLARGHVTEIVKRQKWRSVEP